MEYAVFLQDITSDFNVGTIISVLVGMSALGGAIYRGISWLNKQNEKKAEEVKHETEVKAMSLKLENEARAKDLAIIMDTKTEKVQTILQQEIVSLRGCIDSRDKEFKQYYMKEHADLVSRVGLINDDIKELVKRADLTNGNVAHIRNDISDLAEDVQELFEKTDPNDSTRDAMRSSREKDTRRRHRKREIEADRVSQLHPGEK
jgi:hypothetical protein